MNVALTQYHRHVRQHVCQTKNWEAGGSGAPSRMMRAEPPLHGFPARCFNLRATLVSRRVGCSRWYLSTIVVRFMTVPRISETRPGLLTCTTEHRHSPVVPDNTKPPRSDFEAPPLGARVIMTAVEEVARAHDLERPRIAYKKNSANEHVIVAHLHRVASLGRIKRATLRTTCRRGGHATHLRLRYRIDSAGRAGVHCLRKACMARQNYHRTLSW